MTIVYLWILIIRDDGSVQSRSPHPSYQSCFAALEKTKIAVSTGDENELGIIAYCGTSSEFIR